jgi:hypothetical protein
MQFPEGESMQSDPQRVERLGVAGSFCLFDKKLRASGNSSIVWGLLNLFFGAAMLAANNKWGAVSLLLGLALMVAGVYERTMRDPKVIILSAATLAGLALLDFTLVALAAMDKEELALGGRTIFWGMAQAWGAYATWKTYSTYKMLRETSDPVTVEQVRGYIDELNKAKPEQSVDLVEFEANAGFVQGNMRYRLKPIEDLYLVARYKKQLGSSKLEEVNFIPRAEVTLTPEGGKWMSKKIKASVQLGPLKLDQVIIRPEMAERINPAARMMSIGS